jgi:uncharacterized protein (TIGR04255 family)
MSPTGSSASRPEVHFEAPPVAETILGVQFVPLRKLTLPYQGLFWSKVRRRYPRQEVHPPLPHTAQESFMGLVVQPSISLELTSEPDARCWFIDDSSTQLIQIQRDKFIRNWRKRPGAGEEYPRYDHLRPRFEQDWGLFVDFLADEDLGTPEVNQCEVTYVNHIELGSGWDSLGELYRVLTVLGQPAPRSFLPEPEMFVVNTRFVMEEQMGRLHVSAQPAIRAHDRKQVLQLTLTARGAPAGSGIEHLLSWFDRGHDWIVNGFVDITAPQMQAIWRPV